MNIANNDTHYRSSVASLLWVALFVAVMLVSAINFILVFSDRVEYSPHRTKDALLTMVCWLPMETIVLIIGSMLVFALPVLFQSLLVRNASRRLHLHALILTVLTCPIAAVLSWHCYDYLMNLTNCFLGMDIDYAGWTPWEHEFTVKQYFVALAFQTPISIFSFLFVEADCRRSSKKPLLFSTLALVMIAGAVCGYGLGR